MNGGTSTPSNRRVAKQRYTFQCMLEEVRIAVRFPCRIAVAWNYGEGEVRTATSKLLTSGVAKFEEKLTFVKLVGQDQETRQFYQAKSIVEVSILTDNGTSLAGFVSVDLGSIAGRKQRRQLYEIQRCPDKTASIRMRFSCQMCDDRSQNRVRLQSNYEDDFDQEQVRSKRVPQRSITPRSEYHPQTIVRKSVKSPQMSQVQRNKDVLEKELMILKGRASEMESRFKMQRTEKQKLADTLKNKEDYYFTIKTELKRKEIQLADAGRALEDYKLQYERVKQENEGNKKECEKLQRLLEANDKAAFDKLTRLQTEASTTERKYQKVQAEAQKFRKEKENLVILHRSKLEELSKERDTLNETIRLLRKEKDDNYRHAKAEKTVYEKNTRENHKRISDLEEELENYRSNLMQSERKTGKLDELRNEETTKLKQSITEIQHIKERLSVELQGVKLSFSKKESSLQESLRNTEGRLIEERNSNNTMKTVISELHSQLTNLQVDNNHLLKEKNQLEERRALLEEDRARLEKECTLLKTQINNLSEQLHERSLEIRTLTSKLREDEESNNLRQAKMKELIDELQENSVRLTEQRKSEEAKCINLSKLLNKKEKELEEWMLRQGRLNTQVESVRQQMKKLELAYRDKIEDMKKIEASLKFSLGEASKQNEDLNERLGNKLAEQISINRRLESALSEQHDHLAAATGREHQLRQECTRLNHELTHLFEARELLETSEEKLRDYEWRIEELTEEIRVRTMRQERLEADYNELKNNTIELETDLIKKENLLKDKEKVLSSHLKQSNGDLEEKTKVLASREAEFRATQDEMKETLRRERIRNSEMVIEQERLNNQISLLQADNEKQLAIIATMQSEVKYLKDINRGEVEEKLLFSKKLEESEVKMMGLDESRLSLELRIADKEKEIRQLKYSQSEFEQRIEDVSRGQLRNQLMLNEIIDASSRLESMSISTHSTDSHIIYPEEDSEKLNRIKKLLGLTEGRFRKVLELSAEKDEMLARQRNKELSEGQKVSAELSRLRTESVQLKKSLDETTYSANFLRIENEQLTRKVQHIESDLASNKKVVFQMEMRLKAQTQQKQHAEDELRAASQKYDSLLEGTRSTLNEKSERQRKQLNATIKRLQLKIEEQHEKLFAYELECQKLSELARIQQDNRRLSSRVFQLEKENIQFLQQSNSKHEKLQSAIDNLSWEKKLLQENQAVFMSKNDKVLAGLHTEIDQLNSKNKGLQQQLRVNEEQLRRLQDSLNRNKTDLASAKTVHHDEHEKWVSLESKLKADNTKLRAQIVQLRKTIEQQNFRITQLHELRGAKSAMQTELAKKEEILQAYHEREESLTEQLFLQTQKLEELKYTYDKLLDQKENEIVNMQEELFKANSKDNMRYLKENDNIEKFKIMDSEKKSLNRELIELKGTVEQLQDELKLLQNENDILQEQVSEVRLPTWPGVTKIDPLVSKLQTEMDELREENDRLRCSTSAFRISSEI